MNLHLVLRALAVFGALAAVVLFIFFGENGVAYHDDLGWGLMALAAGIATFIIDGTIPSGPGKLGRGAGGGSSPEVPPR